jgi:signal recognition particle subunit SRP54
MAGRILDLGDVLTLIEQAEKAFDADQVEQMARKVARGDDFTLNDFLQQMQAVRKMGSLGKMLGMLPGMGDMKAQLEQVDETEIDRVSAIIQSMTPAEREDPKLLNASRRQRIARGSGTTVTNVNSLVERFGEAQKMMKQMRGGKGMPAMPGMPGFGAGGGKKAKGRSGQVAKAKKGRSGNPAKRAVEEQPRPATQPGSLLQGGAMDPADVDLPPELRDLFKQ